VPVRNKVHLDETGGNGSRGAALDSPTGASRMLEVVM